jgi:hypothetical protein
MTPNTAGGKTRVAAAPPAPHTHVALDGVLELNGEWHDYERTAGEINRNSGGNTIYFSPGLRLTVENMAGYISFGIPIVNDLNGVQSKPDWRVVTGIAMAFGP